MPGLSLNIVLHQEIYQQKVQQARPGSYGKAGKLLPPTPGHPGIFLFQMRFHRGKLIFHLSSAQFRLMRSFSFLSFSGTHQTLG